MLDSQKRKRIFSFFFSPSSSESGSPRVRFICRPLLYKMCIDGRVLRPIRVVAAKSSLANSVNGTGLLLPCWKKKCCFDARTERERERAPERKENRASHAGDCQHLGNYVLFTRFKRSGDDLSGHTLPCIRCAFSVVAYGKEGKNSTLENVSTFLGRNTFHAHGSIFGRKLSAGIHAHGSEIKGGGQIFLGGRGGHEKNLRGGVGGGGQNFRAFGAFPYINSIYSPYIVHIYHF